jgi:hypothetical protein
MFNVKPKLKATARPAIKCSHQTQSLATGSGNWQRQLATPTSNAN